MEVIDIIILVLIGIGAISGLMRGSIKQLAQIVGFVAGLLLARGMFGVVAEQLAPALGTSITIAQILSFILIWVAVPIGCSLIASVLTKALNVVNLGWLNRLAGALLGAVKLMLLIGLGIYVLEYIDPKSEMVRPQTPPMNNLTDNTRRTILGRAAARFATEALVAQMRVACTHILGGAKLCAVADK